MKKEDKDEKAIHFHAVIDIIGINPFVFVPGEILSDLFCEFGKDKGPVPVKGTINGKPYQQTLVRFAGEWRLYINTKMLAKSPERIGERVAISIEVDFSDRTIHPHPKLVQALKENSRANAVFESLAPSLQNEIVRYIANLKTEASIDRNVLKAIDFLLGKERFIGRDGIK
ncbi:YdeI/OmpD-associated family protein [Fluviicola sp.]|uniref:YdeI/OmpD-associated family protein n=1 Tax=Fluviicola sp. TaxID=1917219 RepID=UPI0031DFDBED